MIEFKGVHKSCGSIEVLKGIDARVEKGEVVCIVGPSGSGKSTMLRCVNGLESYQRGEVRIDGELVNSRAASIRTICTEVSMVFQRFNLLPHRAVIHNVVEGPIVVKKEPAKQALERGRALLSRVGLADKALAYPRQLSGGQQQRVAIARALAMKPRAILFDEPTSALDPELVGEVLSVMRDLAKDGMTILIVTHEIAFARDIADRALFIDRGIIVEEGSAKQVLGQPSHQRTNSGFPKARPASRVSGFEVKRGRRLCTSCRLQGGAIAWSDPILDGPSRSQGSRFDNGGSATRQLPLLIVRGRGRDARLRSNDKLASMWTEK